MIINRHRRKEWALLVLFGVVLGTIFLNVSIGFQGTALNEQVTRFHRLAQSQLEPSLGLFLRICFYRIGAAAVILACIRFMGNYYIFYPVVLVLSLSFGYTLSLLSFCYGIRGIIYMLAYLCPQYFIYIPLFLAVLRETSSQMDRTFAPDLRRTLVIFGIIFLGCAAESYVNPWIIKFILKNFL